MPYPSSFKNDVILGTVIGTHNHYVINRKGLGLRIRSEIAVYFDWQTHEQYLSVSKYWFGRLEEIENGGKNAGRNIAQLFQSFPNSSNNCEFIRSFYFRLRTICFSISLLVLILVRHISYYGRIDFNAIMDERLSPLCREWFMEKEDKLSCIVEIEIFLLLQFLKI